MVKYPLSAGGASQIPNRIIVHAMGEFIKGPDTLWAPEFLKKINLSAHVLITPSGVNIRCRADDLTSWHAKGNNTCTLGIEILVPGEHDYGSFLSKIKTDWVTKPAFDASVSQVRRWIDLYDIDEIARHSDIDPNRKKDPGEGFKWEKFLRALV